MTSLRLDTLGDVDTAPTPTSPGCSSARRLFPIVRADVSIVHVVIDPPSGRAIYPEFPHCCDASATFRLLTSWLPLNGGSTSMDDAAVDLCQQVITRMKQMDWRELVDALNGDSDFATGVMYARAAVMGLVELQNSGIEKVQAASDMLVDLVGEQG
jgi:hypothetical protein